MLYGFEIRAAAQGGYFVLSAAENNRPDGWRGVLLAGTLQECLDFIQREFRKTEPSKK